MVPAVKTICPYCGVGCGVLAATHADGSIFIKGDPEHPANWGHLCSKGSALGETTDLEGRLLFPHVDGQRVAWDAAVDLVASRFSRAISDHGPDSVAFYVSGQLLTEDYYVANKLMKGFIGSANIDTNSRLCMASSVAGHRRAFGTDTVPGLYEDIELADLVVIAGSNLAWCHPVIYQRLLAAKAKRPQMRVVVIDPRATMTDPVADMHLAIAPDGDTALFCGLLAHLADSDSCDSAYIANYTEGFEKSLETARHLSRSAILDHTELAQEDLAEFYALFASTNRTVTIFSQGINQSSSGTDKVNAIINCHLATGRIGKPGCGPFSITGQPNAMGGREVGGLANMLAAHLDLDNAQDRDKARRFWNAPNLAERPGLKAIDLFRRVREGQIKALWIMATNPVDSLPKANGAQEALKACPFVVVSDVCASTDTVRHADVALPALAWGEKEGTVTNSERCVSRQRAFLEPPGEARPDWWHLCAVARRMGFRTAFDYEKPADIYREYAAMTAFENNGTRDLNIGRQTSLTDHDYDGLQPYYWPDVATGSEDKRFFGEGGFYTDNRLGRFVAVQPEPARRVDQRFPMVLNTGRLRDQWHTMTRTGKSPRLGSHMSEPHCEVHPQDSADLGIEDHTLVRIQSAHGAMTARARVSRDQRPGSVFVPIHWTDQFCSEGRVNALVPDVTDPVSGQPASKNVAVRITPLRPERHGFAVIAGIPVPDAADYWACSRANGGWRLEFAFDIAPTDFAEIARRMCGAGSDAQKVELNNHESAEEQVAFFDGDRLLGAFFLSEQPVDVPRNHVAEALVRRFRSQADRFHVVAESAAFGRPDPGRTICACLSVGTFDITSAIQSGFVSVESIGEVTGAGTDCGTCRAEIQRLISSQAR
ncbi:MAG: nitrate reductase [Pseudomonadota bacterium]